VRVCSASAPRIWVMHQTKTGCVLAQGSVIKNLGIYQTLIKQVA